MAISNYVHISSPQRFSDLADDTSEFHYHTTAEDHHQNMGEHGAEANQPTREFLEWSQNLYYSNRFLAELTQNGASDQDWHPQTVLRKMDHVPASGSGSAVPFFHLLERLKTNKREGWRRFGIGHGESIADHMYRMALMTMCPPPALLARGLDTARCTRMALVHDMAESLVGDITPIDGVSKAEKSRREAETVNYLTRDLLGGVAGGVAGDEMQALWREYEDDETLEAHFVHDVDKVELLLQMIEYERARRGEVDLGEFTHVAARVTLPECQAWVVEIMKEREAFWASLGKEALDGSTRGDDNAKKVRQEQMEEYYDKP